MRAPTPPEPPELSPGLPVKYSQSPVFLGAVHRAKLDKELIRRRALGLDIGQDGKRMNLNRSTIIRDLIDEHLE